MALSLNPELVVGVSMASLGLQAPWPAYCALYSQRGLILPSLEAAVQRYADMMIASQFEADIEIHAQDTAAA